MSLFFVCACNKCGGTQQRENLIDVISKFVSLQRVRAFVNVLHSSKRCECTPFCKIYESAHSY